MLRATWCTQIGNQAAGSNAVCPACFPVSPTIEWHIGVGNGTTPSCRRTLNRIHINDVVWLRMTYHKWRMGIHNNLSHGIISVNLKRWIDCYILQKFQHHGDAIGMDTIFRFFKTDHAPNIRVDIKHGEHQKSQRPI